MAVVEALALNPESELGSTVLFLAGDRAYTVDDAIRTAYARGDLAAAMREALALAAAEELAEERHAEPDNDALQMRSDRYRSDHDLTSAGETEEWLAARGLSIDDLGLWLYRQMCAEAVGWPEGAEVPEDFTDQLRIHLWLSGHMEEIDEQLRRRVASEIEIRARGESLAPDAAFEHLRTAAVTDDARRRGLNALRLSLARLEICELDLDSEAAAKEACLCVREDRVSLAEVAEGGGFRATREEIWLDDLDGPLGAQLLGAGAGDVVGPVASGGRFKVFQVLQKIEPSLDDPEILRRVDERIVREYFDELCSRHIGASRAIHSGT